MNTYVVLETLNQEHPESHLAFLNRGVGLEGVGETELARQEYEMAVRLMPHRYGTLTAAGGFWGRVEEWERGEILLRRALEIAPGRDDAYRLLAAQMLRQGRGREAHRIALAGLANAGFHPDLWGAVSESYILKGDLQAALSARQAALAADPASQGQWDRLADILVALGRVDDAAAAREGARRLGPEARQDGSEELSRPSARETEF
jgi:tetratricopeptide (TPR) repeat protein